MDIRNKYTSSMCQSHRRGVTMINYDDDVEVITKNKCVECGDKLTPYETLVCIICEAMAD